MSYDFQRIATPPVSDAVSPNTTPPTGKFFDVPSQHGAYQLVVVAEGGTSTTIDVYIQTLVGNLPVWVLYRGTVVVLNGTPFFIDVPHAARIYVRTTVVTGTTTFLAGVIAA
jgi:hypothetical protein